MPHAPLRPMAVMLSACCALGALATPSSSGARSARVGASLPWAPNSWEYAPVFAFPGASPVFMNSSQLQYFAGTQTGGAGFSNLLIWGINSTCVNSSTGATFPPDCSSSHCYCNRQDPEAQTWVLNMEESLAAQGAALKRVSNLPVLGYIEGLSAQQYYRAQAQLWLNASYNDWMLRIEALGPNPVDCYRCSPSCNWQGVEFRQYDLRNPAMREYYVQSVIGGLINTPSLDGTFLDVMDWWPDACPGWHCTPQELSDLTNASLVATQEALAFAATLGKVISVSCHSSSTSNPSYYYDHIAILQQNPTSAMRFYEFFRPSDLQDLMNETQNLGLAVHVHSPTKTLNPDWVELAVFLLAANDYSYFSYSSTGWMFDSFPWQPEFSLPLGPPSGPPSTVNVSTPIAAWQLIPGLNFIFSMPPGQNASLPGALEYLGRVSSPEACLALTQANSTYLGFTWVNATNPGWGLSCYARYGAFNAPACVQSLNPGPPCWTTLEQDCVSAAAQPVTLTAPKIVRDFAHLHVEYDARTGSATLTPQ